MLWVVGSPLTILIVCPAITPSTCGLYLQPTCVSVTASFGRSKVRLPKPSFTKTKTLATLPSATTIFSAVFEPAQLGSWLMSIFAAFGAAPSNFTVPLTDATVAGSIGVAAGPGVDAAGAAGCSSASFLPHPANRASPGRTQIAIHFLVFVISAHLASSLETHNILLATATAAGRTLAGWRGATGSPGMPHRCAHAALLLCGELEDVVHQQLGMALIITLERSRRRPGKNPVIVLPLEKSGRHRGPRADRLRVDNPAFHPVR